MNPSPPLASRVSGPRPADRGDARRGATLIAKVFERVLRLHQPRVRDQVPGSSHQGAVDIIIHAVSPVSTMVPLGLDRRDGTGRRFPRSGPDHRVERGRRSCRPRPPRSAAPLRASPSSRRTPRRPISKPDLPRGPSGPSSPIGSRCSSPRGPAPCSSSPRGLPKQRFEHRYHFRPNDADHKLHIHLPGPKDWLALETSLVRRWTSPPASRRALQALPGEAVLNSICCGSLRRRSSRACFLPVFFGPALLAPVSFRCAEPGRPEIDTEPGSGLPGSSRKSNPLGLLVHGRSRTSPSSRPGWDLTLQNGECPRSPSAGSSSCFDVGVLDFSTHHPLPVELTLSSGYRKSPKSTGLPSRVL